MMADVGGAPAGRPFDILSLGGVCLEQAVRLPGWPEPGHRRIPILDLKLTPGGSAPNVAVFAARAGARAAFVGKVGDDDRGRELVQALEQEGVNTSFSHVVPGRPTTFQIVLTTTSDWSVMLWADPALDFEPQDVPAAAVSAARFLHLDGYGMFTDQQKAVTDRALSLAHEHGTLVSVDAGTQMALEQPEYLSRTMAQANVAFANLSEARYLTGCQTEADVVQALQALGPALVVLKQGDRGAVLIKSDEVLHVPAFKVRVEDTVGAGDGMVAGMLAGLCRRESPEAAARRGAAVGALACTGAGSMGSRFGLSEIEKLLAEGETYG